MSQYPEYHQWQSLLLGQYSGELAWCAFITGLLLLWLLWRWVFNRWQVVITYGAVAAFYISIAVKSQGLTWPLSVSLFILGAILIQHWSPTKIEVILGTAFLLRLPNIFTER